MAPQWRKNDRRNMSPSQRAMSDRATSWMRKAESKAKRRRKGAAKPTPDNDKYRTFYESYEWADARYDALKRNDGRCELCGVGKQDGAVLNVDHIRRLKSREGWRLRTDQSNLQVLCALCNKGKGNRDSTDWRREAVIERRLADIIDTELARERWAD